MNDARKKELCNKFFDELVMALNEEWIRHNHLGEWIIMESCNQDFSRYLVLKGSENQVTYHSKPAWSFRISDHWNWFANIKKCEDPFYIQCNSCNVPYPRFRPDGRATKPRYGIQVCETIDGNVYRCVYGDCFDRQTKTWSWKDDSPKFIAKYMSGMWDADPYDE